MATKLEIINSNNKFGKKWDKPTVRSQIALSNQQFKLMQLNLNRKKKQNAC